MPGLAEEVLCPLPRDVKALVVRECWSMQRPTGLPTLPVMRLGIRRALRVGLVEGDRVGCRGVPMRVGGAGKPG